MNYFNTNVIIATPDLSLTQKEKAEINTILSNIDDTFSLTKESSDVKKINKAKSGEKVDVLPLTADILVKCKSYYTFTNKKFSPSTLPSLRLWGLSADTPNTEIIVSLPTEQEITKAKALSQNFDSDFLVDKNYVTKSNGDCQIDLGGIAKGLSVDLIKDSMTDRNKGYISVGGSSIYVYSIEEDLSITHPRKTGENILSVKNTIVENSPISTSGDYHNYYELKGKRYCHIIDPTTGKPIQTGFSSITVIGGKDAPSELNNACFLDMLTTAMMAMDEDELIKFCEQKLIGFKIFAVNENNKKIFSNLNIREDFTLLDSEYQVVKI